MFKLQTITRRAMSLLITLLMTCTMLAGTPFHNQTAAQAAELNAVITNGSALNGHLEPAFTAREIKGTYYLKNKASGTYLYALGTTSKSGVALGAKKTTAAYKMKIAPVTAGNAQKGSYITPSSGSVVLNPFSDTPTNGTIVNLYTKNSDGTQYWIFEQVTGGYILHNSYNTNLVLNNTGSGITVATNKQTAAQIWVLESTVPKLSSISIATLPTKRTYNVGESLNTAGLTLKLTYSDGTTKTVSSGFTATADLSTPGTKTVTVSYTENNVTKTAAFSVTVNAVLNGITITQLPDKTAYSAGETLDTTGMQVTASYNGAEDRDVTDAVTVSCDLSQAGTKTATVSYTENGVTKTASFSVTVDAVLSGIRVTQLPDKAAYFSGETLDTTGMKVTASYLGAADRDVTDAVTVACDLSQPGTKTVTVTYTENNITKTASFSVTVNATLTGIKITQMPDKTAYSAGETLDTTGMKVTASYADAADKDVTNAVTVTCNLSQAGTKTVKVSYTENGVTKTATFKVTVSAVLSGITISQLPDKTAYSAGETLDPTGMKVIASYTGAADKDVTDAVTIACDLSQAGTKTVTVSYTENNITKTASFPVTVNAVLTGIKITQMPVKIVYSAGDTLDPSGMRVTASYTGAADRDVTGAVTTKYDFSQAGTKTVKVSYTENNVTKTASFSVTVNAILTGIKITQMPVKTAYSAGEALDTTGMKVTASYTGAADKDVTDAVTVTCDLSQAGTKTVKVSYTENDVTKTATFKVTVSAVLSGIKVTQLPDKTVYSAGETLDTTGMKITASYTGAADKDVTNAVTVTSDLSQAGTKTVKVSYTENGVTKTATFKVTVNAILTGIKITQLPDKTEYTVGEELDTAGMKVTASYIGAADKDVTDAVTTDYDFSEVGEATVTVTFGEATAEFKVNVRKAPDIHFRGEGTAENPFLITSKEELKIMRDLVNDWDTNEVYGQAYYKQTADIDLGSESWIPIGKRMLGSVDFGYGHFNGSYDGDYHKIVGLRVVSSNKYNGLFGSIGGNGAVKNLHVEGSVTSTQYSQDACNGGIAGEINNTVISNCSFIGNIKSESSVSGGLVGNIWQGGTLINCYHIGKVNGPWEIGGIVGYMKTGTEEYAGDILIENCYHVGEVTGVSNVGSAFGEVSGSTSGPQTITFRNVYVRSGDASVTLEGSGFNGSVTTVTDSELKQSAAALGEAFVADPETLNNGFPMLLWELKAVAGDIKITAQPHNQTNVIGYTAKFSVTAEGEGLTYQWQMNNGSGWKNSAGDGATTNTLSIPIAAGRNGNLYRCVITNNYGFSVISDEVMLKVKTSITAQPADISAPIGDVAKFTVTAKGVGLTYQWQYNKGAGWVNSNGTGSKTNTLSINVAAGYNGYRYRCIINNTNNQPVTSSAATLTVKMAITAQPQDVSASVGEQAKFTVTAKGIGLTYQWQYNKGAGWKTSNGTGSKTATLTINTAVGYNGYQYRCIVTDASGETATSEAATLKVKAAITAQPENVSAAVGNTAKFSVTATGPDLTYQWQYNSGSGWKTSNGSGATTATLSITVKASYNGWQYRCIVTDANGNKVTSSAASLTVS